MEGPQGNLLTVASPRFSKKDSLSEIPCLEIPIIYEVSIDRQADSPHFEFPPRPPLVMVVRPLQLINLLPLLPSEPFQLLGIILGRKCQNFV